MIDNISEAQKHFKALEKEYKPGVYFVTTDGQIFDQLTEAQNRAGQRRGHKVYKVEKTASTKTKTKKSKSKDSAPKAETKTSESKADSGESKDGKEADSKKDSNDKK